MGLPNKIKKTIPLTFPKTLYPRREQLLVKLVECSAAVCLVVVHLRIAALATVPIVALTIAGLTPTLTINRIHYGRRS